MVGCSEKLVSRIRCSLELDKPKESETEMWERKLLDLVGEERDLQSFHIAMVSSGILKNTLRFLGQEVGYELLKEIEKEEREGQHQRSPLVEVEKPQRVEGLPPTPPGF